MLEFLAESFGLIFFLVSVVWAVFFFLILAEGEVKISEIQAHYLLATGFAFGSVFWFIFDLID